MTPLINYLYTETQYVDATNTDNYNPLMPELPEVETVRRAMQKALPGKRIVSINTSEKRLREPINDTRLHKLINDKFIEITRRAKYLFLHLESGTTILTHLGMSGNLVLREPGEKHDHVIFYLDQERPLVFNDPRRFGMVLVLEKNEINTCPYLIHLGVEPLTPKFNNRYLIKKCHDKNTPIKNLIMDSRIVVGVGNIYASESLFKAKIHPQTPSRHLNKPQIIALTKAIKNILRRAVQKGGTTINDYLGSGEGGRFQQKLSVYGRNEQLCRNCSKAFIQRVKIAGRSTYFCPSCQKHNI